MTGLWRHMKASLLVFSVRGLEIYLCSYQLILEVQARMSYALFKQKPTPQIQGTSTKMSKEPQSNPYHDTLLIALKS